MTSPNISPDTTKAGNTRQLARGYFDYVAHLLKQLDTQAVADFVEQLKEARQRQSTVFLIGNGGSAATASHMANDIGIGVAAQDAGRPAIRAMALTDNVAVMTAVANDNGYQNVFVSQLKIHYRPGDKLVAISASGNSPNVVIAAEWFKKQGGTVVGMVGFDGGRLKKICDIVVHVETPTGEYGPVEDIHLILNHFLRHALQQADTR
ncbi:MAG: SIS domain-containing protein [Candidatus Omnitrophica bacterium]|nr:SIS domain-containing protein [Candidatus Omnitrophota bacterium]